MSAHIGAVGAGRMGRGMAIAFAYAGHPVTLLDAKKRDAADYARLQVDVDADLAATLGMMASLGLLTGDEIAQVRARISLVALNEAAAQLPAMDVIFEGVPETMAAKEEALKLISAHARKDTIIASTTSTILSDDLAQYVARPERFLNAHWLNPAFLVPLVELSPCAVTQPDVTEALKALLEAIGKVPVVCTASPGYIVPRIQMLAMNEAARLIEEGVASAEDIDKATKYGFGFRFAVLGLLEFIDWGGGDILFHASNYMQGATGQDRFAAPDIIQRNMQNGRTGLREGQGFLSYDDMDVPAYQRDRLGAFVAMLRHLDKMPVKGGFD